MPSDVFDTVSPAARENLVNILERGNSAGGQPGGETVWRAEPTHDDPVTEGSTWRRDDAVMIVSAVGATTSAPGHIGVVDPSCRR